jgi:phosphate:Na+ symporter
VVLSLPFPLDTPPSLRYPSLVDLFFTAVAAIMLYLHSLRDFAREVTRLGGAQFRHLLRRATANRFAGALIGATGAALVQSSSVVNFITMGLTEQKVLPMRSAWTIMIGANVGTTVTAWLIAYKFTGMGPIFISVGGLWSLFGPRRWRTYGHPVFHFGLIFMGLSLINATLLPLARTPEVLAWSATLSTPLRALAFGAALTMLVQSSSVVVGLTVLSVAGGLIDPALSIWVVVGANLGTGWVSLLNGSTFGPSARRLALFNAGLDLCGLVLFVTVLQFAIHPLLTLMPEPGLQVALVHSAFNLSAATMALLLLPWIWRYLERFVPEETQ